ncbi:hypothetical protein GALMADRAFT_727490 [Galerina marginata CBS 339.88]|uniref:Carboxylic ester hydrolase n=1 Tax=Galerina marginata (strain CBS 339.88) TaxID=685588 RepID=A0A067ST69_GALM3|nr:hypothetical protein GALMADRAFT_727490 [Galerina marginata CBS 339.88]
MKFGRSSPMGFLSVVSILYTGAYASLSADAGPIVTLNYGSFRGNATGNLVEFLGMPFAAPPVGNLRFAPPRPPIAFHGVREATAFGPACFQQFLNLSGTPLDSSGPGLPVSEDCLFINVVKPANLKAGKKVPVLFWIYGGGFEVGDTSLNPGDAVVARSIALGEPVIYVSANYRVNAFGFLGGKEAKAAGIGNAGLRDQRFALQWVQDHIATFGGDPTKVTIWGESAGAISVGLHMVANNGDPAGLFRGAVMESGSPNHLDDIIAQQPSFDQLVANTGCTGSPDAIACLRAVPFDKLSAAVNLSSSLFSFTSLALLWRPTIDGQVIVRDALESIEKGLYAKVPFITGDCDDEGTLFSVATLNITTNAEFLAYIKSNYFPRISTAQLAALATAYPDDVTQGSPFDTGTANAVTPQFKRLAAIQGDLEFQAPRRSFLQTASKTQKTFAFLFKRGKATPELGAFHSTDIPEFYGTGDAPDFIGTDALVNFANSGNPNLPKNPISLLSKVDWPAWTNSANPPLLTFADPAPNVTITFDTFRADAMDLLTKLSLQS